MGQVQLHDPLSDGLTPPVMEAAKVEAENLQRPQGYAKSQKQKT